MRPGVARATGATGATVWFTGLPSAGKSTLATAVAVAVSAPGTFAGAVVGSAANPAAGSSGPVGAGTGRRVEVLDGDELRAELSPRLGFTRADRDEHVIRVGHLARLLARNGVLVLVAVIAPYAAARDLVRARHTEDGTPFLLVHVATGLTECRRRDTAGRYAAHAAGRLRGLTGVDDPYEEPLHPDLRLDTEGRTVGDCRDEVLALLSALPGWL